MSDSRQPTSGDSSRTDPNNPEAQALNLRAGASDAAQGSGSKTTSGSAAAAANGMPRDRNLSDVVLYDEPAPSAQASPKSGSSTTPGAARASTMPTANSIGSTPSAGAARAATPVPIAWRVWPVIDSVWELLGLSAVLVVVPLAVWSLSGRTALAAVCTIAVGAVVWRHFVPTICEINALGVTEKIFSRTRRIPWLSIDRYVVGRRGVFLTSAGAPLELFRGLYLPWGAHRDQILSSLRYYLPNAEDAS